MSEKRFVLFGLDNETIKDDVTKECYWVIEYVQRKKLVDLLNELNDENRQLKQSNDRFADTVAKQVSLLIELRKEKEHLRQVIKENVFQRYNEGSLADLEFKAIAYDDIVRVEMSNELEPRVIVYCKQGKKENIMSYCQMVIPFGVPYKIIEVIGNE